MRLALILCLLATPALANSDLFLQGQRQVNLNRPISIIVTDTLPAKCADQEAHACADGAYDKGRCTIWIKPGYMEFLYHELQHCAGVKHTRHGD